MKKKRITKLLRIGTNTHQRLKQAAKDEKITMSKLADGILGSNLPKLRRIRDADVPLHKLR